MDGWVGTIQSTSKQGLPERQLSSNESLVMAHDVRIEGQSVRKCSWLEQTGGLLDGTEQNQVIAQSYF